MIVDMVITTVQGVSMLLLLIGTAPVGAVRPAAAAPVAAAVAFGAWALATMGLRNLRMTPDVARGAPLLTAGPYRIVRHPMYFSTVLGVSGLLVQRFSWPRAGLAAVLLADLSLKMSLEERRLGRRFPDYADYRRRTRRIIPWLL